MAPLDGYFYYAGLGVAIIVGYILSSLRIERLVITAIHLVPERFSGQSAKAKRTAPKDSHNASVEGTSQSKTILEGWTDDSVFELERRAIFSKTWLFVTHASRFQKPGDYRTYELAGFSFIIILGKDDQLRAFHNVCRHRAYAVTKKEYGSSTVLGCRYHGWSYDTKGILTKAPEFDKVPGFDKSKNGLWEVKIEIREGMIFANLDSRCNVENLELGESELVLRGLRTGTMKCIADWKMEIPTNWKWLSSLQRRGRTEQRSRWFSLLPAHSHGACLDLTISGTTIIRQLGSGILLVMTAFPKSSKSTVVECTVLSRKPSKFAAIAQVKIETSAEIDGLISRSEKNRDEELISSVFAAPAWAQAQTDRLLEKHLEMEMKLGAEIHPASRNQSFTVKGKADDDFCKELEGESICRASSKESFDW